MTHVDGDGFASTGWANNLGAQAWSVKKLDFGWEREELGLNFPLHESEESLFWSCLLDEHTYLLVYPIFFFSNLSAQMGYFSNLWA